jgi:hypothetical protein
MIVIDAARVNPVERMGLSISPRFCPMPRRGKEKGAIREPGPAGNDEAFVSLLLDIV